MEEKILRKLVIRPFHINEVVFGKKTSINKDILTIKEDILENLLKTCKVIEKIDVEIIKPGDHNREINTIMDIIPISTKVLGRIGEGITHTLTGVYVMLTGVDKNGRQMHEFGSSEGILSEKLMLGKRGTPGPNDYIIHMDVTLKGDLPFARDLALESFRVCDDYIQEIREVLKYEDGRNSYDSQEYFDIVRPGKKKVVIVKEIAGQGAMYDNMMFMSEPSGFADGVSIIDMCNMPMVLSPNEFRDGILRSMT
ncbi:MAG: proline reductase cluster protein PrdD [Clostridioides sp.]|jgi:D-proline reductase (dithiol) PrdD|nr:proline reductase cluster protein PrdD [Clostridioides sp.]